MYRSPAILIISLDFLYST